MPPAVVLVADDSRTVRAWVTRSLRDDFDVVEAHDGAEAVRQARLARPDVVLLDVDMPGMNGHQALAAMRTEPALRDIPVLFLTGRTGADDVAEGLGLGAMDYLRKPCHPQELIARVQGALRIKVRHDQLRRTNDELSQENATDELTGLGNRRAVTQRLPGMVKEAAQRREPLAVLIVDIDRFKSINDTHGHLVGDVVLVAVAQRLCAGVRSDQLVARWGGEEFIVVSPSTALADAAALAERLRGLVAWEPVRVDADRSVEVTVSVGVAGGLGDVDDVIRQADAALYAAKEGGRNRVVTAPANRRNAR